MHATRFTVSFQENILTVAIFGNKNLQKLLNHNRFDGLLAQYKMRSSQGRFRQVTWAKK